MDVLPRVVASGKSAKITPSNTGAAVLSDELGAWTEGDMRTMLTHCLKPGSDVEEYMPPASFFPGKCPR